MSPNPYIETPSSSVITAKDLDLDYVFPIICHGDDADSHRRRSFCCFTIASPLAPARSSWDTRILCYVIDTSRAVNETYDTLDAWIVHGLCELQEGKFFTVDVYGQPWSRGKSGRICGSYIGLQRALKLKTSATADRVCMYCAATGSGGMLYTQFGPSAPHRGTLVSNVEFMLHGCHPKAGFDCLGFMLKES